MMVIFRNFINLQIPFTKGIILNPNVFQVDTKSGFENKGVYIYHYKDYQLIRLD